MQSSPLTLFGAYPCPCLCQPLPLLPIYILLWTWSLIIAPFLHAIINLVTGLSACINKPWLALTVIPNFVVVDISTLLYCNVAYILRATLITSFMTKVGKETTEWAKKWWGLSIPSYGIWSFQILKLGLQAGDLMVVSSSDSYRKASISTSGQQG